MVLATTTAQFTRSIPYIVGSARIVREFEGIMVRLAERHDLSDGVGMDWNEISLGQINAQGITETTVLENPATISEALLTNPPVMDGIPTHIPDNTRPRITPQAGAGNPLSFSHITAAVARIRSNTTEPAQGPIYAVLHGYQIKDILDEVVAGIGTYPVPKGMTEDVFRSGFHGSIMGAEVYEDGNITIDSADDAKGAVFAREGVILVDGFGPKTETDRLIRVGGGANELIIYDEFAYGERSAGNWLYEIYSDATAPTA